MPQSSLTCTAARLGVWLGIAAMAALLPPAPAHAQAQEREALLMPGKQSLQQRVLTKPAAKLRPQPGASGGEDLQPFSVFYVYGRRQAGGGAEWLEVGRSSRGRPDGWIEAERTIEWKHNLTVAFTNPANRKLTLFLRDEEEWFKLLATSDAGAKADQLRTQAVAAARAGGDANSPVIALEPTTHIDIRQRFYLLPILEARDVTLQSGFSTKVLQVASIIMPDEAKPTSPPADFKVGVAFVLDTSLSMDPYIDRARESIRDMIGKLRGSPVGNRFSFALIGYRNDTKRVPELEYVSKVFATFADFADPDRFMKLIGEMKATRVDSRSFDEDAIAGLKSAITDLEWSEFGGRYIVLVTDAGTRKSSDQQSSTRMGPQQINDLARETGIATYVMHLLTPAGGRLGNHGSAKLQHEQISGWPNLGSLYYPIANGSVEAFGERIDELTQHLLGQLAAPAGVGVQPQQAPAAPPTEQRDRLAAQTALVGHAMRLAYVGRQQRTAAPDIFKGWTVDRDVGNPDIANLEVRLLLTKNQLSDLQDVLRVVLERGTATRTSAGEFFGQLRSAAANLSRNPARLRARNMQNLGDLMGEFLDDLPYRSEIGEIDQDTWVAMGAAAQREVLDTIEAKIRLYREFDGQRDLWVSFDGGRVPGDAVYPVPLSAFP